MGIQQHYLGWDQPAAQAVRDWLIGETPTHPINLNESLVLVPTRQAGRRLREALAVYGQQHDTAVLSPRAITPAGLLRDAVPHRPVAGAMVVSGVWTRLLEVADLARYPGLFPHPPPSRDFSWALETGEMIQNLRTTLSEGGYGLGDVVRQHGDRLEESERWMDLAELEKTYLEQLADLGYADDLDHFVKQARKTEAPEGITRIVLAALPDPSPVVVKALEQLAAEIDIEVLVLAPEDRKGDFDEWGRPSHGYWHQALLEVPDSDQNILLAGNPADQSRRVLEVMAEEAGRFGPEDIAIGVPDSGVTPYVAAELEKHGLPVFDPAGDPVSHHPVYQVLEALHGVLRDGSYQAFSTYLRQAPVLQRLCSANLDAAELLAECDAMQNTFLPQSMGDIQAALTSREAAYQDFSVFQEAFARLNEEMNSLADMEPGPALRKWLIRLYEEKAFDPAKEPDETYLEVAAIINARLIELEGDKQLNRSLAEWLEILLTQLGGDSCNREREDARIDLEGWLELPWNDAPVLIVTGMNEGMVPDGSLRDVFLPDSLRRQVGLRHDGDRLARDSYLMQVLVHARPDHGRTVFIAGKTTAAGDPLKPSRLLFRCPDEELPKRAERLFRDLGTQRENIPASISFTLDATPPPETAKAKLPINDLSVTSFRSYLACPFRFYLSKVLDMAESNDNKEELDAMDFGSLVHYALDGLGKEPELAHSGDEVALTHFLWDRADYWVKGRFTLNPSLPTTIQVEAARQRLAAAARVQAGLAAAGWEIIHTEKKLKMVINGFTIVGKIDRIDRHADGRLRVLDYKTSDRGSPAEQAHLSTLGEETPAYAVIASLKNRAWTDLQLPLYRMLLEANGLLTGPAEPGYFNLTKAAGDCGIYAWEDYTDELHASARTCMEGVLTDIAAHRFWPPADPQYDDFEALFLGDAEGIIDGEKFMEFWEGR